MTGQPRKKVVPARLDLAAHLKVNGGAPTPVTLLGVDAEIRRVYTGEEALAFGTLAAERLYAEIFDLILGPDNGPKLWELITKMAIHNATDIINTIVSESGLFEGKLVAPLPPS